MTKELERLFSYGTLQQDGVQLATFGRLLKGAADVLVGFKQELVETPIPTCSPRAASVFIQS